MTRPLSSDRLSGTPSKRLFSVRLAISPEYVRCSDMEQSILYAFFHCPVVRPLCKFLEGFMVRVLNGKVFVLEASSVCNTVPSMNRSEHYVFLCLPSILRVVILTTRQKEFHDGKLFSSQTQIKIKIRSKIEGICSLGFGTMWVNVARMCHVALNSSGKLLGKRILRTWKKIDNQAWVSYTMLFFCLAFVKIGLTWLVYVTSLARLFF